MPTLPAAPIFISYSRRDDETMRKIAFFLRDQGLKVWVDNEKLIPGTHPWEESIENAIKNAFAVIVILSPDSKSSEWVRREITYADQFNKRVFPVLIKGTEDESLPLRLVTRQYIDLRADDQAGLQALMAAITFSVEQKQTLKMERPTVDRASSISASQGRPKKTVVIPLLISAGVLMILCVFGLRALGVGSMFLPSPNATKTAAEASTSILPSTRLPTPTPLPNTVPPIETLSENGFRDDFDGHLENGWTWMGENPAKWSLTDVDGSLLIMVADASFDGPAVPPNILLRDPPAGDFEITTVVRFTPTTNYQAAGLVVFQEHGNVLQLGRAFCDVDGYCLGDGIYFDNFENGSITGNSHKVAFGGQVTYLRLQRIDNVYAGYFSDDGVNWTMLGKHVREFSQARVGLVAAQSSTEIPAVFDYFTMNTLQP